MIEQATRLSQAVFFFLMILGTASISGASNVKALEGSGCITPIAKVEPVKAETRAPKIHRCYLEEIFWALVRGSSNPKDIESYLREFPDGRFAGEAKRELETADKT
jgi:hypothetical protein